MARVRAPELRGRGWLNTGGKDLHLADFRGKILLLDFWTFCCINCLHVLDELRPLEEKYGDVLTIVGVHSPKFEHERDPDALVAAVERYEVAHPVLDDPQLLMWNEYAAKAWPTLSIVDPEGYLVASMAGEGHAEGLARLIDKIVEEHEAKGTLHRGDGPYVPPPPSTTTLRFPGKALALVNGNILVSDSARHSIVELAPDAETVVRRIGTGERGRTDGAEPSFSEPQGLCVLPEKLAGQVGYDVVVADTVNHLLRGIDTATGVVTTIAGSGRQWRSTVDFRAHDALSVDLSSPWDVAYYEGRVIIAMAGIHQLWWFDPAKRTAGAYAGTTVESLKDGDPQQAWLSQPSGLSVTPDGRRLWFADSESSALRFVEDGQLHTAVGQGLFDFGHVDGIAADALLQHPLGVCALADGSVLIADTYNGAVRRFADGEVTTVASGLAEPSDVIVTAAGDVLVVESAAHQLTRLAPGVVASIDKGRLQVERPPTPLRAGEVTLEILFSPPPGQKLDDTYGPSTRLEISAAPPELLLEGQGVTTDLTRRLVVNPEITSGILQVVAQAATCDADIEHAACHLTRQDWGVPVTISADAPDRLPLALLAH
ncbi:NHL domain-containing thioredoxin family protein [Hamadaea tsunoensis]|uniref:NHL domain-containing thioredoxin family protein n=1 Tax=Hamadaea tsunoensis TaxID=53368 RepID=UPI0004045F6F|nr:NHL domain-containing thioredoxin family protein [Hamadaea tsunoensis]